MRQKIRLICRKLDIAVYWRNFMRAQMKFFWPKLSILFRAHKNSYMQKSCADILENCFIYVHFWPNAYMVVHMLKRCHIFVYMHIVHLRFKEYWLGWCSSSCQQFLPLLLATGWMLITTTTTAVQAFFMILASKTLVIFRCVAFL